MVPDRLCGTGIGRGQASPRLRTWRRQAAASPGSSRRPLPRASVAWRRLGRARGPAGPATL